MHRNIRKNPSQKSFTAALAGGFANVHAGGKKHIIWYNKVMREKKSSGEKLKKLLNKAVTVGMAAAFLLGNAAFSHGAVTELGGSDIPEGYTARHCLDISEHQKDLSPEDFVRMKEAGVSSVIIRAGFSRLDSGDFGSDAEFSDNIKNAEKAGLEIGVYYFSAALTEEEAKAEALYFLELIEPYKDIIGLPVCFDFETNEKGRFTAKVLKEMGPRAARGICEAFCREAELEGYDTLIYANRKIAEEYLNDEDFLSKHKLWLAQYLDGSGATGYEGDMYAWQYSSSVRIPGIEGRLDASYILTKEEDRTDEEEIPGADEKEDKPAENRRAEYILSEGVRARIKTEEGESRVKVVNAEEYVHSYRFSKDERGSEAVLASLLSGYYDSENIIDSEFVKAKILPAALSGYEEGKKLSMEDISETLTACKIENRFIREVTDGIFVDIKSNLARGDGVIISNPDEDRPYLFIGLNEEGKGLLVNHETGGVDEVSLDAYIKKIKPCERENENHRTENRRGGYILAENIK